MSIYSYPVLLAAIFSFIAGCIIYNSNRKSQNNISFSLFCFSLFVWLFGYVIAYSTKSEKTALFFCRVACTGAMFTAPAFYHFSVSFTEKINEVKFVVLSYVTMLLIVPFSMSSHLFLSGVYKYYWGYYSKAGYLHPLYLTIFFGMFLRSFYLLWKERKRKDLDPKRRVQIKYIFTAYILALIGAIDYIPKYGIEVFPFGFLLEISFVIIVAYAIFRHQLLDIEIVIKRTIVFASLFAIVFGIFVGITLLIQQLIGGASNLVGLAVSSLVIVFTVRPIEIFLIRVTDKYLFQKKYDYKHLIREFMDELKTMVLNTTDIAQSTVDFLNTSIRPIISAVFMYNRFTSRYDLVASNDFKDNDLKIAGSSELVKVLGDTGKIVIIRNDNRLMSSQESIQLITLGIELIIPLLIHKELIGFLCLSKKKSDEDYSTDDTEALSDLSGALSISLNNAQLFDERADAEKRALVGTIATGINHEVGNPLNIITIKLDTFRILAKEGLLAHKTKEEIIEEVDKITKVCLDSAQRIAEITKQVSEFAKPDKKLIFGKVGISEAIDETIAFLKHGMILDSEKIDKRILCEPAYVFADRGQLKQILFNLIKNASHAIDKEKGKIIVNVDKSNSSEIAIKIIDNGHGMPKEVKDKVFTPFFTTKEPGKGTGLGLALVKIMVDRNNAKIKVESEEGKGTTFTLIFKGGFL